MADVFYYKTAFISISLLLSTFFIIKCKSKKHSILILIISFIQNFLSFFFFVNKDFPYFHPLLYFYLHGVWYIFVYCTLFTPKLRSFPYKLFISWTAAWYTGFAFLGIPFIPLSYIFNTNILLIIASIIAFISLIQSLFCFSFGEIVYVDLANKKHYEIPTRIDTNFKENIKLNNLTDNTSKYLRVFQMTDVHIGSFISIDRVNNLCNKILTLNPDLVLLTGDFYTVETRNDDDAFIKAFEPLKKLKGKVFTCLGNHDYEQLDAITNGFKEIGIELLDGSDCIVETRLGKVQILGSPFFFNDSKNMTEELYNRYPRKSECILHITLMHNPQCTYNIPDNATDLTFCGHFHGGQVGLLAFGINFSFMSLINLCRKSTNKLMDNGLWGFKKNRIYSHRGTGYYGLPLRMGIPSEESLMLISF